LGRGEFVFDNFMRRIAALPALKVFRRNQFAGSNHVDPERHVDRNAIRARREPAQGSAAKAGIAMALASAATMSEQGKCRPIEVSRIAIESLLIRRSPVDWRNIGVPVHDTRHTFAPNTTK
jgi:hypothetical protein